MQMKLLKYFDLNRRIFKTKRLDRLEITETKSHFIQQWLSPVPEVSVKPRENILMSLWAAFTQRQEGQLSFADQLLMYLGVLLGVYFSGVIRTQSSKPTFILAAFIALSIVPAAFEKLSINPKAPMLVKFGLFVQNGVFWDVMFQAIGTRR
ncbi:MAG: hypothetical protein LH702_08620 [Phormidesmis sp. CAN_BIN44]|nr:hypothetical protein [Phormidesmis sp. CAN_BIN44]